jgi:multimeric flavodoxin WrbA
MKRVKVLDLTSYKTAAGAAKAAHRKLQEYAVSLGQRADEVFIKTPAERWEGCTGWFVCWEGGPFEWGVKVSCDYDCDDPNQTGGMPVPLKCNPAQRVGWMTEPYWSFSLVFYAD